MISTGSVQQTGKNSWKLTVSGGYDGAGKRIRYTKTVRVSGGTVEAQEAQARKQLALFISDIDKGNTASSGKMTLSQFYEFWKKNYALKNHEATTLAYNDFIFARIKEVLGYKRLDKIEPKNLLAFYANLAEPGIRKDPNEKRRQAKAEKEKETGKVVPTPASEEQQEKKPKKDTLSSNTIRKHHALLSSLFAKAVQWNLLPYNPAERVEPPKAERKPKEVFSQDDLGRFLQALEGEEIKHRVMVLLALTGGLRREEIFGLTWRNFDQDKNTIRIDQASVYVPGKTIIKGTKNASSNRLISIPPSVTMLLSKLKAEQSAKRLKLGGTGEGGKWKGSEDPEDDFVFPQWNGAAGHPHGFNAWLKRFIKEKNLPPITPHGFRHMSATYLIAAGTDIRTVSGKLGHAQTSTTMNIYAHLLKSAEQETAATLETFLQTATEKLKQTQNKQAN